jgi:hypothetical protein
MPTPYYLNAKATELPEGHDDTLDPAEAPVDPQVRSEAPSTWPVVNPARGGLDPPDAPLAPPPTDPATRSAAPFSWPGGNGLAANRPMRETTSPVPDLDPDIAMWPTVVVSIWPFSGTPPVGIWPTGWFGIDNRGVPYVCIAGGQPGNWQALTPGGGTNANALQGTPINATAPTTGQSLVFDGTQWTPGPAVLGTVPVGGIVMTENIATIPTGWLVMNGQTVTGGTTLYPALAAAYPSWISGTNLIIPDRRNRFPVGGGNQYAVASVGGAANTTLNTGQIPQFSNVPVSVTLGGSTGTESAPHNHNFPSTNILTGVAAGGGGSGLAAGNTVTGIVGLISSSENVNHSHGLSGGSASGSVTFGAASPAAVPTLPPYFGVNFIVRAQ